MNPASDMRTIHQLKTRVERLESEMKDLQHTTRPSVHASDAHAKELIENYLRQKKIIGKTRISLLDVALDLHLSVEQANKVMNELKQKGIQEVE